MSSCSAKLFHDFLGHFYSRRLLLHVPVHPSPDTAIPPVSRISHDSSEPYTGHNSFDANLVVVLSVISCAIVCLLGLHSIIKCALRCTCFVASGTRNNPSAGLANTGINKKVLRTFPTLVYSDGLNLPGSDTECVICLSEFTNGEGVRVLPKCNHGFHVRCIDMWLNSHSSCPTCRHSLIETCEKIERCSRVNSSESPPPQPETIVNIVPLQPEGLIRDYRNDQDVKIYVEKMKVPSVARQVQDM